MSLRMNSEALGLLAPEVKARLRGQHTCTLAMSSMNCRACNRGVPYPHMTVDEIIDSLGQGRKEREAAEKTMKRSPRR